jgi:diguanylate cyclase (GGDEF)-like protein
MSADLLSAIAALSVVALVALLCAVLARDPAVRHLLGMFITGLGAGGLILFRQLRKTSNSLRASQARAHYAATHDQRTQLANKSLFIDRLLKAGQTLSLSDPDAVYGVLCIGLDRFEEVNEILGFGAGDEVVVEIAKRLTSTSQEQDTVARLGDDMFGLLWSRATRAKAEAAAIQMIKLLSAPCEASAGLAHVTCSIGVGFLTADLDHPEEALRQAQLALSSARRLGGAQFCFFEPAMDQALKNRSRLEVELRRALDNDALTMVYQPQVDAKGTVVGVEALMRWTSERVGEISPAIFVPLAESCGLSDAVGGFALRQAFLDAKRWPGLKVAINIPAAQVKAGSLIPTLKALLLQSGVSARNIELEITEGVLLADEAQTYETLNAVRKLGFTLALDDFGTGYSSLSYLRRFPIDKIKIDRSFISQLGKRPESSAIVKAIVELADALALKVIAEGVETREQVDRLADLGCTHFQGYFYSAAVEASVIDALFAGRLRLAA